MSPKGDDLSGRLGEPQTPPREQLEVAWARVREIEDRTNKARGTAVRLQMEGLGRSIAMLETNAAELTEWLDAFADTRVQIVLWNEDNDGLLDMFLTDIARRLHNYVASVMSLVEHNRRTIREQYAEDDSLRKAYQGRVMESFGTGEVAFMQDLRDFTLHYELPPLSARFSMGRDQPTRSEILLDRDRLRTFSGWSQKGKGFLAAGDGPIDLRAVVDTYMKTVRGFYQWFTAAVQDHHAADMAELNGLVEELRAAFRAAGHGAYVDEADALGERRKSVVAAAMARARAARNPAEEPTDAEATTE
jgi:hypothetical protein